MYIAAVCLENRTKPINALCGAERKFWNVKTSDNHCALKGYINLLISEFCRAVIIIT
jgi:hypothetical protein